jgi:hypothetical protein
VMAISRAPPRREIWAHRAGNRSQYRRFSPPSSSCCGNGLDR